MDGFDLNGLVVPVPKPFEESGAIDFGAFLVRYQFRKLVIKIFQFAAEKGQHWLEGKTVRKIIVVPGRLVNIAVS
jgi:leucyl-tRNA synthetase